MTKYSQHSFDQENYPELDEIHVEILEKLLCSHNLQGSLSHDAKYNLNQGWHRLDPWSDSTEGLASLQKSAITATLSNGTVRLLTDLSRYGNLHFDVIFSGETFLSFKPNAAMYLGAVRLLKLKPEEVCMVAAHGKDLQFAKKNGLKTAFVYREGEGHAADEISTALSYIDVRVQDLIELSTLYHSAKGPSP
jgi:2-haloacid dehalogenase